MAEAYPVAGGFQKKRKKWFRQYSRYYVIPVMGNNR
jgi:hypothetical protein